MTIETIMNLAFYFLVTALGVGIWGMVERGKFVHFNGEMKRGVKIWSQPLSEEMGHFLGGLSGSVRKREWFIRKKRQEMLIVNQSAWSMLGRQRRREPWVYVGYVDLQGPTSQLEFRAQWSSLASFVFLFAIYALAFFGFYTSVPSETTRLVWFFPPLVIGISVAALAFTHLSARARVLDVLRQATVKKEKRPNHSK